MERVEHDLTHEQWMALVSAWGGCAYCGAAGPLQRDCVLALSRGGRYTLGNIVPACRRCNASKGNDEVTAWMRRTRLDERTFLLRDLAIRRELSSTSTTDADAGPPPSPSAAAADGPESPPA